MARFDPGEVQRRLGSPRFDRRAEREAQQRTRELERLRALPESERQRIRDETTRDLEAAKAEPPPFGRSKRGRGRARRVSTLEWIGGLFASIDAAGMPVAPVTYSSTPEASAPSSSAPESTGLAVLVPDWLRAIFDPATGRTSESTLTNPGDYSRGTA